MGAKLVLAFPSSSASAKTLATSPWLTLFSILAADMFALSSVYWLAVVARYLVSPEYALTFYLTPFPLVGLFLLAFLANGLYPGVLLHPAEEIRRVFYSVTTVLFVFSSLTFFWRNAEVYSRSVVLATWLVGAPAVLLARYTVRQICAHHPWWGHCAIVLGSGVHAQRVVRSLAKHSRGLRVTGFLSDDQVGSWPPDLPPVLGALHDAKGIPLSNLSHYAIVAISSPSNVELRQIIQDSCKGFRHILLVPDLPGICSIGVTARQLGGEVGFEVPQRLFHSDARVAKRLIDITLGGAILLMLSPVLLVASLLIALTSRGSVFFRHSRHGKHNKTFEALKFRTMVQDADTVLADHLLAHPEHLLEWQRDHKLKKDPRVTVFGRWLRRYSLDELPQLLNVVRGDMSLVGPRPIVEAEIQKYGRHYDLYTQVLPGITGLWQVSGRNNTTYDERVAFDEYYVRNWSIWLDFYILVRTVKVLLSAEGAY